MPSLIPLVFLLDPAFSAGSLPSERPVPWPSVRLLRTLEAERGLAELDEWLDGLAVPYAVPFERSAPLSVIRVYSADSRGIAGHRVVHARAAIFQRPSVEGESAIILVVPDTD